MPRYKALFYDDRVEDKVFDTEDEARTCILRMYEEAYEDSTWRIYFSNEGTALAKIVKVHSHGD